MISAKNITAGRIEGPGHAGKLTLNVTFYGSTKQIIALGKLISTAGDLSYLLDLIEDYNNGGKCSRDEKKIESCQTKGEFAGTW
ncbi:hypothetical protein [Ectothiorhodospira shaposhnikovii]|uniref:hypothetical protein n=1 Tax=Ectothiorhodospira shaposhnikovii TaxID=1054 RepID=UPI001EE86C1C|nr:hypothetical protein [Ectothiorhodospira shaposhnikovii]MCG5512836.1 hypothetical protein [Ectothiorhodospira shaposhnikovii]